MTSRIDGGAAPRADDLRAAEGATSPGDGSGGIDGAADMALSHAGQPTGGASAPEARLEDGPAAGSDAAADIVADDGVHADEVTRILGRLSSGDRGDLDRLLELVYDQLRRLAQSHLQRERADHTLPATALVHEAYLRLVNRRELSWKDRTHFFAAASTVIRRILVDHARARHAVKRGGERRSLSLSGIDLPAGTEEVDLLSLNDALTRLGDIDQRQARIVELRFFGGLTVEQVAEVLEIGARTVDREWQCARTWLYAMLGADGQSATAGSAS